MSRGVGRGFNSKQHAQCIPEVIYKVERNCLFSSENSGPVMGNNLRISLGLMQCTKSSVAPELSSVVPEFRLGEKMPDAWCSSQQMTTFTLLGTERCVCTMYVVNQAIRIFLYKELTGFRRVQPFTNPGNDPTLVTPV